MPSVRKALVVLVAIGAVAGVTKATSVRSRRARVTRLVVQIQRADYRGDRAALLRLHQELAPFGEESELGAKVRYWRGFAMWRRALNGFNDSINRDELELDLKKAIGEFEASMATDPTFVDPKIGAGACLLNLLFIHQKDEGKGRDFLVRALPLLKEAERADPQNPRLLWIRGSSLWYQPPEFGGGQERAIDTYHTGLKAARERKGSLRDPLTPHWGEPELLMNLAWSNLNRRTPDLGVAEQYARSALAIVPYWHYVKDLLLPQIKAARAKQAVSPKRAPKSE